MPVPLGLLGSLCRPESVSGGDTGCMNVRRAVEADARVIAEVHVRSWQAAYVGLLPDTFLAGLSADDREPVWREILVDMARPANRTLVLTDTGTVVGFAHFCPSRDPDASPTTGEVTSIYLSPDAWGRGGGRLLLDQVIASLREGTFTEATLWVLDTNRRARRFYEAAGWLTDGAEKTDDRRGFPLTEVRYRRPL